MDAVSMVALAILFIAGLWLIIVWGGKSIAPPAEDESRSGRRAVRTTRARRFLWWSNIACIAALISGLLITWPGGRLAMRVLAATSPDSAQGRLTEAQETVGEISLDGTLALLFFGGMPAAFVAATLYMLVYRWLPSGRVAGPLAGLLALIVFGATVDPLRANNIDFTIIRSGWLSVLLFTLLAVLVGAAVAAVAGRISQRLPLPSRQTVAQYLPLLGSLLFPPVAVLLALPVFLPAVMSIISAG